MSAGRPTTYEPEYAKQAKKLAELGATDQELADFFEVVPSESDFFAYWLSLRREDRCGVIADQKKKQSEMRRKYLSRNPSQRIRNAMAARLWAALKGRSDGALFSRLGYTVSELMVHLESKFTGTMCWSNYGKWHVDHIKPCASFDLTKTEQFAECWALENLQPLWAQDNCRKGS